MGFAMIKKIDSCDYTIIASLFKSDNLKVSVAYKGEKANTSNLYILNEIPYDKSNLETFKTLFSIYSNKNRPREFVDFFVYNENFYSSFTYIEAPGIKEKFVKELVTSPFEERCKILENILIRIENIFKISPQILACVTEPENIRVDNQKNIILNYNLQNLDSYKNNAKEQINNHLHDIIYYLLQPECDAGFNKQLHIVLYKCKHGVYTSVPEMVIELKKAEQISKTSSWVGYLKYQYNLRKPTIKKITKTALSLAVVLGIGYLVYMKLNEGSRAGKSTLAVSIGNVMYNGNSQDSSEKSVSAVNEDNQASKDARGNVNLAEGLDIAYEDYIVQYDDTITSICQSYYNDESFVTAVSTFNGINVKEKLIPGSILKLPNRTAIALYSAK